MPKKIQIKQFNGIPVTNFNPVGGNVPTTFYDMAVHIPSDDLNLLYYSFAEPFINQGPFYMGSVSVMNTIYTNVNTLIEASTANQNNLNLLLFRDVLTILVQARDIYFDNIKFQREINVLRCKYRISEEKILDLTQRLLALEAEENGECKNMTLVGSLGIKLHKPKNLIYAQAILNINLAWYYYLHQQKVIDPKLYMATVQYVKTMGSNAYANLIGLLDERYKE
jgi:hypothetical protein